MKVAARDIAAILKPLRFQMQAGPNDITFVRPSARQSLFERVECVYVGSTLETLALSVALSTVQHTAVQFRGLFVRDGWPELYSDRENGRVSFRTAEEVTDWLARLAELALERFERFVREKGDTLLSTTKEAREWAGVVADTLVGAALTDQLRDPFGNLNQEQTETAKFLMQLPLMVSSEDLRSAYAVAIATLIRSGDDAVVRAVSAPTAIDKIARLRSVPNELHWRIRLLVDRIITRCDESVD